MTSSSMPIRNLLLAAGILGLTGVAMGAFGAHALRATLAERGMTQAWETGARYHVIHAIAVLAIAGCGRGLATANNTRWLSWSAVLWVVGVLLFSGSLYGLALGGPRWLGPITP